MGTNFFLNGYRYHQNRCSPEYHIGKRSAAGLYCWDCDTTLQIGGETCPKCGQGEKAEGLSQSAAGRELGFNNQSPQVKTGVASCSSFTWAMHPGHLEMIMDILEDGGSVPEMACPACGNAHKDRVEYPVEDEYGHKYSIQEFREVLTECPIQFHDAVGTHFS